MLPSPVSVSHQRGSFLEVEAVKASLPVHEAIYSRKWTTEQKRFLHEHRQRDWLQRKAKHGFIDFSDSERAELRRYFDALATANDRISLDRLETMLISLGLASTRKEVRLIVSKIDSNGNGQLDFEEYLEIFRSRSDSEIFQVFKAMMEGRLGDPNLNFQTVISNYRRNLFLDATGARSMGPVRLPSDKAPVEHSAKVLHNFATLQKTRYDETNSSIEAGTKSLLDPSMLPFDPTGMVPPGGLGMVWRGVTNELELAPSRPPSADGRRRMGPPQSPRQVIDDIVKAGKVKKTRSLFGNTVVIQAPALEEGTQEAWRRNKAQPLNEDDA